MIAQQQKEREERILAKMAQLRAIEEEKEIEEEARRRLAIEKSIKNDEIIIKLRKAFAENRIDILEGFIRERLPQKKASRYFRDRTTMANLIRDECGWSLTGITF